MGRLRFFLFFLVSLVLHSCSCGNSRHGALRLGVDAEWYPIDFGPQQNYVNGFVEDLLLETARYSGIEFVKMDANWDTLLDGIREKKYDAVLSSLPPYSFNEAKYDFSHNFLDLGPVLILPVDAHQSNLGDMKGELVGIVTGDPASMILQKHPEVIMRNYPAIPDLLNALAVGEIEGALLNRIPAVNFVADLYAGRLKIVSDPMTDAGLHLVAAKGKQEPFIKAFNKSLEHLRKKKILISLLKKWNLEP